MTTVDSWPKNLAYAECLIMKFHYRNSSSHDWWLCGQIKFAEWNSKVGFTQLFWYYSFYSRHSFLIYVLLGNYQLVPAHSVSFRVLQIGQNHFSSHIFINFCLSPQSSVLITIIESNVQAVFHSFLRIQHHTLRYYIFCKAGICFMLS